MRKLFALLLLCGAYLTPAQDTSANVSGQPVPESVPVVSMNEVLESLEIECNPEEDENCDFEENRILQFLMTDVIPAFGQLRSVKPSFSLTLNSEGVFLNECKVDFMLKQSQIINYVLTEEDENGFDTHLEIGQPLFIDFDLFCDNYDFTSSQQKFDLKVSIKNEDLEPTFYQFKVTSFEKEQIYVKLWSADLEVTIQETTREMVVDSNGFIKPLGDSSTGELVLEPVTIVSSFKFQGQAQLSLPTAIEGVREETPSVVNLSGSIYLSDTGEVIPAIDISME